MRPMPSGYGNQEGLTGICGAKGGLVAWGACEHRVGSATKMFGALSRENINIMMISTSEIKVSCVIDEKYTELAVRVLHDAFGLEKNLEEGSPS